MRDRASQVPGHNLAFPSNCLSADRRYCFSMAGFMVPKFSLITTNCFDFVNESAQRLVLCYCVKKIVNSTFLGFL